MICCSDNVGGKGEKGVGLGEGHTTDWTFIGRAWASKRLVVGRGWAHHMQIGHLRAGWVGGAHSL